MSNTPLSNRALDNFLRGYLHKSYIAYNELPKVRHINDLFGGDGFRILIYDNDDSSIGHWALIICRDSKKGLYEYFDSYGNAPDVADHIINGTKNTYLLDLFKRSNINEVEYNDVPLQKHKRKNGKLSMTCGKWVLHRIIMITTRLDEYVKQLKHMEKYMNLDDYVDQISVPVKGV